MALALIATSTEPRSPHRMERPLMPRQRPLAIQKRAGKTEGHGHEQPHREVLTMTRPQA